MGNTSDNDEPGIMQSLEGVRRLKQDKIDPYQQTPRKKYRINTAQHPDQTVSSLRSVSHSIPETTQESWFHHGIQKKLRRQIKTGQLTIDGMLDLHGHTQRVATEELKDFFQYAISTQARMLLIVHGKGFNSQSEAVLRPLVQHWLSEQSVVLAFCPAQPKDGGTGASYVYLKKQK